MGFRPYFPSTISKAFLWGKKIEERIPNTLPSLASVDVNKQLGSFYKKDLPSIDGYLDVRLLNDKITKVAQQMISGIKNQNQTYILLGTSGDGKTRSIYDVARNYYTFYMEAATTTRDDKLYATIHYLIQDASKSENCEEEVKLIIMRGIVAKLTELQLLYNNHQLTPQQYLVSQRTRDFVSDIFFHLRSNGDGLEELFETAQRQRIFQLFD